MIKVHFRRFLRHTFRNFDFSKFDTSWKTAICAFWATRGIFGQNQKNFEKHQISIIGEGIYQKSSIYRHYKALSKANKKDPFFYTLYVVIQLYCVMTKPIWYAIVPSLMSNKFIWMCYLPFLMHHILPLASYIPPYIPHTLTGVLSTSHFLFIRFMFYTPSDNIHSLVTYMPYIACVLHPFWGTTFYFPQAI